VFYPAEGGIEARRISLGKTALANENAQEVFEHVVAHPGTHQREIARALGVNHGTVRWHLRKMEEAELLAPVKKEHTTHYYLSELGRQAVGDFAQRTVQPITAPAAPPAAAIPGDESGN
jgi:predicted transcriptional regulator